MKGLFTLFNNIDYTKISDKLLQNTKLRLTSRVIYARLIYRMNLSVTKHDKFYDRKGHFYYVIYQINDLMHDCGLGQKAVRNALSQLIDFGLVKKHKPLHFTRVLRFELPKLHLGMSVSAKKKPVNRIKTTRINKSDSKSDNRLKGVENRWTNTNIPKYDDKLDHQNAVKAIKYRRVPKPVIKHIHIMLSGTAFTKCIGVLLQAKKSVFNDHKKLNNDNEILKGALNFDYNDYFTFDHSKGFTNYIDHGLRKAWHNSKSGKLWHYFMKVCKTYYNYALRWFKQQDLGYNGPEIPIFKI